jgi:hypothetical protein
VFDPLSTRRKEIPEWLRPWPEATLTNVAGGRAIAVRTRIDTTTCSDEILLVEPGAGACGTIRISSGPSACQPRQLRVDSDGTVWRESALEQCNDWVACTCTFRSWRLLPP